MSSSASRPAVGFIGLGRMGLPMTRNLLLTGYAVTVHSRSAGPVEQLVAEGATAAAGPTEVVAAAEVVLTALPSIDASREVFLGERGLVAAAAPGRLLIDVSTVPPELSREIHEAAATRGVAFLDAPISGGPEGARDATLTIMAGGDPEAFERALPVLRALGSNVHHVGPSGSGSVVKLANQLLTAVNGAAVAEAVALGLRNGVTAEVLGEVIGTSFGDSRMFRRLLPMIAARDFSGGAVIELYIKDIGIVADMGHQNALNLPLATAVLETLRQAQERGIGPNDISALVTQVEGSGPGD